MMIDHFLILDHILYTLVCTKCLVNIVKQAYMGRFTDNRGNQEDNAFPLRLKLMFMGDVEACKKHFISVNVYLYRALLSQEATKVVLNERQKFVCNKQMCKKTTRVIRRK